MINELIKIENLQIGDVVLVSGNDLRALEILKLPKLTTKTNYWGTKALYTIARCKRRDEVLNITHPKHLKEIVYYDFNYHIMWLIERK